jgi:hypothetical protein
MLIVTEFVTLDGVAQAPGESDEDRDDGVTAGVPTYGNLAIGAEDVQSLEQPGGEQ